jgi:hypothetical protein
MIEISHNIEDNIIHLKRSGEIYVGDLIEIIHRINKDFIELKELNVLDDTGQSVSKFNHGEDYNQIITAVGQIATNFDHIRHSIVADTPANAALSSIYEMFTGRISNYTFRFFSSDEAAKHWLLNL